MECNLAEVKWCKIRFTPLRENVLLSKKCTKTFGISKFRKMMSFIEFFCKLLGVLKYLGILKGI